MKNLPPLPYRDWQDTLLKLHLMAQIVGKLRLSLHPPINHWWHVTTYLSARGLTTGAIPYSSSSFEVELDLLDHQLVVRTGDGRIERTSLAEGSVADFYGEVMSLLERVGIRAKIRPVPYKCRSQIPFAEDRTHAAYDREAVARAFTSLRQIDEVFKTFRSRFLGKCSPVHMFWHSFDLAVTRFNGKAAPPMPDADRVSRLAYTHEVISSGFWFGDDDLSEAAFYTYASPSPGGLERETLAPAGAAWEARWGMTMALLRYEDLRRMNDPRAALLDFLETSYAGAARRAAWERGHLEIGGR